MSTDEIKAITPIAISAASLCVSAASWLLSLNNYKRDTGRLDVYIGLGEIMDAATLKNRASVIQIKVVNSGRRPVLLTSIGGDYGGTWWKNPLNSLLNKTWIPTSFMFNGPKIDPLYLDESRQFRLLTEGQVSSVVIPVQEDTKELRKLFEKASHFYITDTLGKKHFASKSTLSKFKKDLITRENEASV